MRVGEGQIIKRNGLLWYDNEAWQDDRAELERLRAENERLKSKLGRVMAEVEHDHGMEYLAEIMAQVEACDEQN